MDERNEVLLATEQSMSNINSDNDTVISYNEVRDGFRKVEKLLHTTEEVSLWLRHAVGVPDDIIERFEQRKVTGRDILDLMKDDGALLTASSLNITDRLEVCMGVLPDVAPLCTLNVLNSTLLYCTVLYCTLL